MASKKQPAATIEKHLRAGRNPEDCPSSAYYAATPRKTPVSVVYPPTGAVVRFVEMDGTLRPLTHDLVSALIPNNCGWANGGRRLVLVPSANSLKWSEVVVSSSMDEAVNAISNIGVRVGRGTRIYACDTTEMIKFLLANMKRCAPDAQPDFKHVFADDRDELLADNYTDDAATVKLYNQVERENAKIGEGHVFNADLKAAHERDSTGRVFHSNEVTRRAMVVCNWEQRVAAMRERALNRVKTYKLRWGIVHADFADERLIAFTWAAHGAYMDAKRQLKLARARMATACLGHAQLLASNAA